MSQLAGLISRRGEDVTQRLLRILGSPVRHDAYGIATATSAEHSPQPLAFSSLTGSVAVGYRLLKVLPTDNPQPIHDNNRAITFIGRLNDPKPNTLVVADTLRDGAEKGLRKLLTEHSGSWVAAVAEDESLICARDSIGTVPLYYGQSSDSIGVATDTKTIKNLGMEPQRVAPGHIVKLNTKQMIGEAVAPLYEPLQTSMSFDDAVNELDKLLIDATSRACKGLQSPTLAFSGGIDSVLIAHYMRLAGAQPRPICVGAPDSADFPAAEKAADILGLSLSIKTFTENDIEEHLKAILASVEEADPMKVSIAVPLYYVAQEATSKLCRAIFTGNGSDELFGGYAKYVDEYQKHGEGVKAIMFRDVARSHEVNLERDWKVCSDLGLELRLPYTDPEITRFALSLPLKYKLPATGREPRKIVLRQLAKRHGLPDEITAKPKKATQYSSGSGKIIEKLARKCGKTTEGYLAEILLRVTSGE